jgi:hypothetical protein
MIEPHLEEPRLRVPDLNAADLLSENAKKLEKITL